MCYCYTLLVGFARVSGRASVKFGFPLVGSKPPGRRTVETAATNGYADFKKSSMDVVCVWQLQSTCLYAFLTNTVVIQRNGWQIGVSAYSQLHYKWLRQISWN